MSLCNEVGWSWGWGQEKSGNSLCPWAASTPVPWKAGVGVAYLAQGFLLGVELTLSGAMASLIPSAGALHANLNSLEWNPWDPSPPPLL